MRPNLKPNRQKMPKIRSALRELYPDIALVILVLVVFIFPSFNLSAQSRMFPLILGIALILLVVIRFFHVLINKVLRISDSDYTGQDEAKRQPSIGVLRQVCPIMLWLSGLLGAVYILGMVLGAVLFTFCFVKFYGRQTILASFLPTLVVLALVYGLFGIAMEFPLHHGVLQVRLPGLL